MKKNKRSKSRKCSIHGCSITKRTEKAQTGLSNLREGQPHPTLEALVFCGFTNKGTERWRTEDELEADALYQKKYFIKNASKATLKKAAERKAAGVVYDKQADRLLNLYKACGITLKKFKSLN